MSTELYRTTAKSNGRIPNLPNYHILPNGRTYKGKVLQTHKESKLGPTISIEGVDVLVAVLTSIAYKGYIIPVKLWSKLKLYYADGDINNVSPHNIAHQMYPDEVHVVFTDEPETKYKIIPNFTRYGMSDTGIVRRIADGRRSVPYRRKDGYVTLGLYSDIRQTTTNMLRHRLRCLVYTDYPINMDDLDINHINGIPGDDWLDNLEWVTRTYNNNHAVDLKLNTQAKTIRAINILTREVIVSESLQRLCRLTGSSPGAVCEQLKLSDVTNIRPPHYKYSYNTNPDWGELIPSKEDIIRLGLLEVLSGNEVIWVGSGFTKLGKSELTGVDRGELSRRFYSGNTNVVGVGYSVRYRYLHYSYDGVCIKTI